MAKRKSSTAWRFVVIGRDDNRLVSRHRTRRSALAKIQRARARGDGELYSIEPVTEGYPDSFLFPLFEHMSHTFGLTLLDSELDEIMHLCRKLDGQRRMECER